jgi:hypothetical protein
VVAGAAIGGVGWLCVTGFDVQRLGDIRITGSDDALRAAALVVAGGLAALAHAFAESRSGRRAVDPLWAEFYAAGLEPDRITERAAQVPRQRGVAPVERRLSVHPKEPRDG